MTKGRVDEVALHTLADRTLARLFRGVKLYRGGFGDRASLDRSVERVEAYASADPPLPIDIRWGPPRYRADGAVSRSGAFVSPAASSLPEESRLAVVELFEPVPAPGPVVVLLAATADEGFVARRLLARSLHASGVATLMLENPFYGARRPEGQVGAMVRTVAEQFAMNLATVEEARSLALYLRERGHPRIGLSGYSQGGFMAAFAAASLDIPVAVIPRGAGRDVSGVFLDGALSLGIDWDRLSKEAGGRAEARAELRRCLSAVRVDRLGPPLVPRAAIIVAARQDGFVSPEEAEALFHHWEGSELRWSEAGHITAFLFDSKLHARAIVDALDRLP